MMCIVSVPLNFGEERKIIGGQEFAKNPALAEQLGVILRRISNRKDYLLFAPVHKIDLKFSIIHLISIVVSLLILP